MMTTTTEQDKEPKLEPLDGLNEPAADDELGAYLDADLGGFTDLSETAEDEPIHPEQQHEEAVKAVPFFRRPGIKLWGSIGGFSVVLIAGLGLITHSCDGVSETKTAAQKSQDPKDKLIAALKESNQQLASQIEKDTQQRQRQKYLETAAPKSKDTNKAKPKSATVASASGSESRPSYSTPTYSAAAYSRPSPARVVSFPAPERPRMAPVQSVTPRSTDQSTEIASLKAQLKTLLVERAAKRSESEVKPDVIASAVPPVEEQTAEDAPQQSATDPNYQNVVSTESAPVAQLDGGIEEAALLSGRPPLTIAAGTQAKATLLVPIVGERSQVVLSLDSDIIDAQGRLSIPAGAKLLGYGQIVNGVASINLQTAVINGLATELPQTAAIAVLGEGKQPIIAKKIAGGNSGPGMGRTLLSALLDAGSSGIGQLLAPQTSTTISSGAGITSQTINPPSTLSNAGLAAAGGLTTGISSGLKSALSAQPQTVSTPAMGVKAGLKLNLVFTSPLEMLSAQAIGPEVGQDLITSPDDSQM